MANMEVKGATRRGSVFACDKCGKTDAFRLICHADGIDFADTTYKCECGNTVFVHEPRDEEDMMYWMDECEGVGDEL